MAKKKAKKKKKTKKKRKTKKISLLYQSTLRLVGLTILININILPDR
jgi:hypothetical protein